MNVTRMTGYRTAKSLRRECGDEQYHDRRRKTQHGPKSIEPFSRYPAFLPPPHPHRNLYRKTDRRPQPQPREQSNGEKRRRADVWNELAEGYLTSGANPGAARILNTTAPAPDNVIVRAWSWRHSLSFRLDFATRCEDDGFRCGCVLSGQFRFEAHWFGWCSGARAQRQYGTCCSTPSAIEKHRLRSNDDLRKLMPVFFPSDVLFNEGKRLHLRRRRVLSPYPRRLPDWGSR